MCIRAECLCEDQGVEGEVSHVGGEGRGGLIMRTGEGESAKGTAGVLA